MLKFIVISGCSGGGKSTILNALKQQGYFVVEEVGREVVKEHPGLIERSPKQFAELLVERSIDAYRDALKMEHTKDNIVFFDRSFIDAISFYKTVETANPTRFDDAIENLRYYATVFMTPPWKEIYRSDDERQHSFDKGVEEYHHLIEFYPECGYEVVLLPKESIEERLAYLIDFIDKKIFSAKP